MDQSSLSINLLRRSALSLRDLGIHWASKNDAVGKTKIENIHSQGLEVRFGASDSNYSGGGMIISEDFNSLVFQLSHVRKQHVKNCFQLAKRRALADILALPHAANDGAV